MIKLYTFAQTLPEFDLPDRNIEKVDIRGLLSFTADKLRNPFYQVVFDPTDHDDTSSVSGDLIDDSGDTYKDIKNLIGFDHLN